MSDVLHTALFGLAGKAFWYHFAIMFEALFILTTVDAGTRVARFMLSDSIGNIPGARKFRDPSRRIGAWVCSAIVVLAWGMILLMGVTDPLGGISTLFPLFGIANQLLAAIALTVVFTVLIKKRLYKWCWISGVPLVWDLVVTLTASYQKIFSSVPAIGYWAQHNAFKTAQESGAETFGTATSPAANAAQLHRHSDGETHRRRMGGAAAADRCRAPGSPLTRLTGAWRGLRWWVGSVLGDTAYAQYVEHLRRSHSDAAVPTEREYWRQRYAEQDADPGARCC